MKDLTNNSLAEVLQRLLERLEAIQAQTSARVEEAAKIAASLDKLAEVAANLELHRNQETRLINKLETLASQLEKLEFGRKAKPSQRKFEQSFRTFIAGAKTVGQIMEMVANSVQTMMDSIAQAVEEFRSSSLGRTPQKAGS